MGRTAVPKSMVVAIVTLLLLLLLLPLLQAQRRAPIEERSFN